mmetsp:Transcript_73249/g.195342  ORF Transcript_73249/g.195342 Transcript_73249/m.195342 type:complete len:263 (+) Transcript_73249:1687-2475(+)
MPSQVHQVLVADEGLPPHLIQVLAELGLASLEVLHLAELVSHRQYVQQRASGGCRGTIRIPAGLPKTGTRPQFTGAVPPLHLRQPATWLIDGSGRPRRRPRPPDGLPRSGIGRSPAARRGRPHRSASCNPRPSRRLAAHPDLQRGPWSRRQLITRDGPHPRPTRGRRDPAPGQLAGLRPSRGKTVLGGRHHGPGGPEGDGSGRDGGPGPRQPVLRCSAVRCQTAKGLDDVASHCRQPGQHHSAHPAPQPSSPMSPRYVQEQV